VKKETENKVYTRSSKITADKQVHKSAITDHVCQNNHLIDWGGAKFVARESDWRTRGIKEAIWIRKTPHTMNRDEGRYTLPHLYDDLLSTNKTRGREKQQQDLRMPGVTTYRAVRFEKERRKEGSKPSPI